jgi:hypothetical protein
LSIDEKEFYMVPKTEAALDRERGALGAQTCHLLLWGWRQEGAEG